MHTRKVTKSKKHLLATSLYVSLLCDNKVDVLQVEHRQKPARLCTKTRSSYIFFVFFLDSIVL